MTIETKIAKNGSKRYYVRDNNGKLRQISAAEAQRLSAEANVEDTADNKVNAEIDDSVIEAAARNVIETKDATEFEAFLAAANGLSVAELRQKQFDTEIRNAERACKSVISDLENEIDYLKYDNERTNGNLNDFALNFGVDCEEDSDYIKEMVDQIHANDAKIAEAQKQIDTIKAALSADEYATEEVKAESINVENVDEINAEIVISEDAFNVAVDAEIENAKVNKNYGKEYYRVDVSCRPFGAFWHETQKEITSHDEFATLEGAITFARNAKKVFSTDHDNRQSTRFVAAKVYYVNENTIAGKFAVKKYELRFDGREDTDCSESTRRVLAGLDGDPGNNTETPDDNNGNKIARFEQGKTYFEIDWSTGGAGKQSVTIEKRTAKSVYILGDRYAIREEDGSEYIKFTYDYITTNKFYAKFVEETPDERIMKQFAELPADDAENNYTAAFYVSFARAKNFAKGDYAIASIDFARAEKALRILKTELPNDEYEFGIKFSPIIADDDDAYEEIAVYYVAETDGTEDDDENVFDYLPDVAEPNDVGDEDEDDEEIAAELPKAPTKAAFKLKPEFVSVTLPNGKKIVTACRALEVTHDKTQVTPIYGKTPRRVLRANLLKTLRRQQATLGLLVRPTR